MKDTTQTFPNVEWRERVRFRHTQFGGLRAAGAEEVKPGPNPVRKITTYDHSPFEEPRKPWDRIEGGELPISKVRITCKYQAKLLGLV